MKCTNPQYYHKKDGTPVLSSCGQCMACRINHTKLVSMRLLHEAKYWDKSCFLTLTYDNEHIPVGACGRFIIVYKHMSGFWKRLRDRLDYPKIKYYFVGEYGEETGRCHFHAILFGLDSSFTEDFQRCWKFGFIKVGDVTEASCDYVAGYVQKKYIGKLKPNHPCFVQERAFASGGLGLDFALEHYKQWIQTGLRYHGALMPVPRLYKNHIPELADFSDVRSMKYIGSPEYYKNIKIEVSGTDLFNMFDSMDKQLKQKVKQKKRNL